MLGLWREIGQTITIGDEITVSIKKLVLEADVEPLITIEVNAPRDKVVRLGERDPQSKVHASFPNFEWRLDYRGRW